jgi:uncharacterized protein
MKQNTLNNKDSGIKGTYSNHVQKTILFLQILTLCFLLIIPASTAIVTPGIINNDELAIEYRNVTVYAPAVGQTTKGYTGVISTITITIQSNGSGRVFVDTLPLAQIDMQGSARLAVNVATAYVSKDKNCPINPSTYDYFFVIRTDSPIIGGPSAGGIMTSAVISLLENWDMDEKTVMTGMINPDGSIGPIGGIPYKIDAAHSVGATRFLIPEGQDSYTEQIYETVTTSWGQQIVSRTVTKSVTDYAMENYGIVVTEVTDINDVLEYYTGYTVPLTSSNDSISTEQYVDSMKPLATTLLEQAETNYANSSNAFNTTTIPNYFPYYYRNQITDYLNYAKDANIKSHEWFSKDLYYSSTSKSFQSLINSRFVSLACEYFSSEDKENYFKEVMSNAQSYHSNESSKAKQTPVTGAISLQCVGAAQKRASEAAAYLSAAQNNLQRNDDFNALYQIAFAIQRTESIGWWLGLQSSFNDTNDIEHDDVKSLANDYIQDAQQSIIYSQVILQELGKTSSLLTEAEEMLENARSNNEEGYYAAALFEALEALSKGNLALEIFDATTTERIQSKLERANESASAGISESRSLGIEPVLAVSYYEYAESLLESNVENSLFYYKYSNMITGVLTLSSSCRSNTSSRYVGIPISGSQSRLPPSIQYTTYMIFFAGIWAVGGILIGFFIGLLFFKKDQQGPIQQTAQKNIQTYYPEIRKTAYTQESFPQNIYDFYKKNK